MPYILFDTHRWQRATSPESGYKKNHGSVSEDAAPPAPLDHAETQTSPTFAAVQCDIPSEVHTMSLSRLQATTCRLITLQYGHLWTTLDFKHFSALLLESGKHSEPNGFQSLRAGCWQHTFIHPSRHPANLKTFRNLLNTPVRTCSR